MAVSYFGIDAQEDYTLNNFRTHFLDEEAILLVNDYGAWVVLNKKEYTALKLNKQLSRKLFALLKENGMIITKDNIDRITSDFRNKLAYIFQGPSLHIISVTSRCNQNCVYCHSKISCENSDQDLTNETAKKIVEFIFQSSSHAIKIEFQGGEPLANFSAVQFIVDYANEVNKKHKKHLDFALSTNLTLMTDEILDFIIRNDISVTTSLDGHELLHDSNRPYASGASEEGTYKNVAKWINKLRENHHIEAILVITKESLKHSKQIIDEYIKLGLNLIWIQPVRKKGIAIKNWNKIGYTADEFFEFWKNSLEYIIELNKKGKTIKEITTTILLKKILKKSCLNFCSLQSPCGGIISQLAYDEIGNIYTCDDGRNNALFKLGNVKNNSYEDLMLSESAQNFIKSSMNEGLLCDACVWKPYCGVCPVCNYYEQGNIIPKLALSMKCALNKKMFEYLLKRFLTDEYARDLFLEWSKPKGIT